MEKRFDIISAFDKFYNIEDESFTIALDNRLCKVNF